MAAFDVDWLAGISYALIPMQTASAAAVAKEVNQIIGGKDSPMTGLVRLVVSGCAGAANLTGVDGPEAKAALYSTVHGAGRLFGRKETKRRFSRTEMDAWLQERGVTLVGADLDESPMAYRRLPDVLARHSASTRVLHRVRPFAVAMAGEGEFDPFKD